MAQPVGYVQITQAVRRQSSICITYACESKGLVQICIAGNGHKTSKLAKHAGSNCQVSFRFSQESEAEMYNVAYLEDLEGHAIGVEIPISKDQSQEKDFNRHNAVRREPIRTQEYKVPKAKGISHILIAKWAAGFLGALIVVMLWFNACSESNLLQSFDIQEAFFQDAQTIVVSGQVVWHPDIPQSVRNSPKHEIKLQLWCDGIAAGAEQVVGADHFHCVFPYVLDIGSKKNYVIRVHYREKFQENWSKAVTYHSGYPIMQLAKLEFDPQQRVVAQLAMVYNSDNKVTIALAPAIDEQIGMILDSKPIEQTNPILLGPITSYGQFWVLLQTENNRILDQRKITPHFPLAKISTATWSGVGTIMVRGSWDGPADLTGLPLILMDVNTKTVITSATMSKTFQHTFQIPEIRHEYQIYLQYHDTVLDRTLVAKPKNFQEYAQILDEIAPWLTRYDRAIQNLGTESNIPQGVQQLQEIVTKSRQYQQTCQLLVQKSRPEDEVASVQRLYTTLADLAQIVIDAQQRIPADSRAETWNEILRIHCNDLQGQLTLLQNIMAEFRQPPVSSPVLSYLDNQLQRQQKINKIEKWLQHINTCAQSGQYELAIDLCTQAGNESPEVWQFLWARYQLYRILAQTSEFPHKQPGFQRKANEDQNQLLQILRERFSRLMAEQNYSEAYLIGYHLLQIKQDISVQQKMDEIKAHVPLEILVSVYRKSPKVSFSLESLDKNK